MIDVDTMGVNGENFGGYDAMAFGILANLNGLFSTEELGRTFKYTFGLGMNFFGFGQMGVGGTKESLTGVREFKISAELISDIRIANFNIGSMFKYNLKTLKYENGEVKLGMFTLAVTGSLDF